MPRVTQRTLKIVANVITVFFIMFGGVLLGVIIFYIKTIAAYFFVGISLIVSLCVVIGVPLVIGTAWYRVTFHPLAKYPGPLLACITDWYSVYHCYIQDQHFDFYQLHLKYGPIVRYGPNRLSFNTTTALHAIYGPQNNTQRSPYYTTFLPFFGNANSSLTTLDPSKRKTRREITTKALDALLQYPETETFIMKRIDQLLGILCPADVVVGEWAKAVEIEKWLGYFMGDVMGDLVFGDGSGGWERLGKKVIRGWELLGKKENREIVDEVIPQYLWGLKLGGYMSPLVLWPLSYLLPTFKKSRKTYLTTSKFLTEARSSLQPQTPPPSPLHKKEPPSQTRIIPQPPPKTPPPKEKKDLYAILLKTRSNPTKAPPAKKPKNPPYPKDPFNPRIQRPIPPPTTKPGVPLRHDELVAECTLFQVHGFLTLSTALSALIFFLLNNSQTLKNLQTEIRTHFKSLAEITLASINSDDPKDLRYLKACIKETLRLFPPIPGILPRKVLAGGIVINNEHFPASTEVGVPIYAFRRNPQYYPSPSPDPQKFRPGRWLSPSSSDLEDFLMFPECIGQGIVEGVMGVTVARLVWGFDVRWGRGGEGLVRGLGLLRQGDLGVGSFFKGPLRVQVRVRDGVDRRP